MSAEQVPALEPCPFCERRMTLANDFYRHAFQRRGRQCVAESISILREDSEAIAAWNRRAAPNPPALGEAVEAARRIVDAADTMAAGPLGASRAAAKKRYHAALSDEYGIIKMARALLTTRGDDAANVADAARYRYLRDHCSSHYPMTWEQPAEWSIGWEFQQIRPDERYGSFDSWIDKDIAQHAARQAEFDAADAEEDALPLPPKTGS